MLIQEFSDRAAEYLRLAERARSAHDRRFFLAMARAWCGEVTERVEDRDSRLQLRPH
jgi:hypothetical protein